MRTYRWPILSGVLFASAFYPFPFWPLILFALAPLYFFATDEDRSLKEIFWGGCIAGLIICVPLYYFTLAQLVAGLGLETFTLVIRFLSIPAALLEATLFGLLALVWRILRTRSPLVNVLVAASAYVVLERSMILLFQGYNPDALAYAVVSLPGALTAAAIAGIPLVSFLVASISMLLGEFARRYRNTSSLRGFMLPALSAVLVAASVYGYGVFISPQAPLSGTPISLIQIAPTSFSDLMFGGEKGTVFVDPPLQSFITQAAEGSKLVIYPFSPVDGFVSDQAQTNAMGAWLGGFVPTTTATLLWVTTQVQGKLYDQYALWQNDTESVYQKNDLYAFSDYTPAWARALGVEKSPFTISPGTSTEPLVLDGLKLEGLICSELHQDAYARAQAGRADVLIAAGYDAFFPGPLMGEYSLVIARYRAAENNMFVVRANFYGPSAIINPDGAIQTELSFGKRGIVRGFVAARPGRSTLYARFGSFPLYAGMVLCVAAATYAALRRRFR